MNIVFSGVIGLLFLIVGIRGRMGYDKGAYLSVSIPVLLPNAFKYIWIPLGIFFIALELIASNLIPFQSRLMWANLILGPWILITLILAVWQPPWLLPTWLQYLRKTYGYTMTDLLLEEARNERKTWFKRVETHEGLVTWSQVINLTAVKQSLEAKITQR